MNIHRFKKIIVMYMILFVLLCLVVPCNVYLKTTWGEPPLEIQYGINYKLITDVGYRDFEGKVYIEKIKAARSVEGIMYSKLNISILVIELVVLSVLFAGTSYITCFTEPDQRAKSNDI